MRVGYQKTWLVEVPAFEERPPMSTSTASSFPRSGGILLHPTSLPSPHGIGDLGAGARSFVRWLKDAGLSRWQVLPLVPPGPGGSPYSSPSALAGNPLMIDLQQLAGEGFLDAGDVVDPGFGLDTIDWARVIPWKNERLRKATARMIANAAGRKRVDAFLEKEPWVREHGLFMALKERFDNKAWTTWPSELALRTPAAVEKARAELAPRILEIVAEQCLFDEQWRSLRAYCATQGVTIVGDIPIYVDLDSVDVWTQRDQFLLSPEGKPLGVAGVPPDAFTELGQLWGNPLYDWKRMKQDGHKWWVSRMKRVLSLCDVVRIDHFRAFAAYWAVPFGDEDARGGTWVKGPGLAVFDDIKKALGGDLPIILEDLGVITPDVEELRDATGLPGMKVLQFAFGEGPDAAYLPHNHVPNCVIYTGTHDNNTSLGYWRAAPEHVKEHIRRYLARDGGDFVWDFIRTAFASVAHTAIVPMQDVLCLDEGARFNMPGSDSGNWAWRVRDAAFHHSLSSRLRDLAELYDRAPHKRVKKPATTST
jgi:4-alpha-glucanotransferase